MKLFETTSLKANITANFIGNGWSAIISLLFVPIYLRYIGAEGYGLIGIFASLQVVLSLLDSGLSTTLNKELAKLSVIPNKQQEMSNLVKTLGNIYWVIAFVAGIIALILTPLIAKYWVHPKDLSVQTITYAFILLSISVVFQFPSGFYMGGLLGLQRQVILNILRILFSTLRSVGVLLVLVFVSKSVIAFFGWILIVNIIQAFVYKYSLWTCLPKTIERPVFSRKELKNIWRFAAGMTAIGLTSILLTQVDKIVLSKVLLLEQFGYYTFAFTLGSVTYMIVGPICQSYFPKFSTLLAEGRISDLSKTYHQGCQMVTLLVLPVALFLAIFSKEIIFIWTKNSLTVENTWQITSVVALAVSIHCLVSMPYMLCLTYNYTKLAFYTNIVMVIIMIPGTIFSAIYYGGLGGAVCWLILTIVYLFVNPVMIHKLFLKGQVFKWYWDDTFKPLIGCILILLSSRLFLSNNHFSMQVTICLLAFTGITAFIVTLLLSRDLKENLFKNLLFQFQKNKIN